MQMRVERQIDKGEFSLFHEHELEKKKKMHLYRTACHWAVSEVPVVYNWVSTRTWVHGVAGLEHVQTVPLPESGQEPLDEKGDRSQSQGSPSRPAARRGHQLLDISCNTAHTGARD